MSGTSRCKIHHFNKNKKTQTNTHKPKKQEQKNPKQAKKLKPNQNPPNQKTLVNPVLDWMLLILTLPPQITLVFYKTCIPKSTSLI